MDNHPLSIDLADLDWSDQTFAIRSYVSADRLEESLDRFGPLNPPWVWLRSEGKYTIIDGFKRLSWARGRNRKMSRCLVFPPESDLHELMLRRVETKILGPTLNVAEKAQILYALLGIVPNQSLIGRFLPELGISGRGDAVDRWRRLVEADSELLEAAASEYISERTALELACWEEEARTDALNLLRELRCSASIQKEILERIGEIAVVQKRRRFEVLRDPELKSLLHRDDWNHRRKTQALRDLLMRWRFPTLSAREIQFKEDLASVSLPKALRVMHPPDFEGENWQLQVSFSDPSELRIHLQSALDFADSPSLRLLMASNRWWGE